MSEEQKKENVDQKEEQQELKKASMHRSEGGFNLIAPQLQKAEEETQDKFRVDIRVVLFVFFVVLISLSVVGYNWFVNMRLDNAEAVVADLEEELEGYRFTIESNSQILERYDLYESILEGFISSKEVLSFWQEVSENLAEIRNIELTRGVNFEVSGRAETLRDVTELWHFLSIDDRVNTVTLEGVSIPRDSDRELTFSFEGELNLEYFNQRR